MANIKKIALGLLVAVLAFGFSAFKNVKPTETKLAPFYYVNNGTTYTLFSDGTSPDVVGDCDSGDTNPCAIQSATALTLPIPSDDWQAAGGERVDGSEDGLYTGN